MKRTSLVDAILISYLCLNSSSFTFCHARWSIELLVHAESIILSLPWCCHSSSSIEYSTHLSLHMCFVLNFPFCVSFFFEGKPTDYNYNHVSTLLDGSTSNNLMMNNNANAGRTNFTNKQLTVKRNFRFERVYISFFFCFEGIGKRISFQPLFNSSTTHWNRCFITIEWNTSEGKYLSHLSISQWLMIDWI